MLKKKMQTVADVNSWRMCIGCGVCASVCPQKNITLIDYESDGIRPLLSKEKCVNCHTCVSVCPGTHLHHDTSTWHASVSKKLAKGWGPVIELWEGYASNEVLRKQGSSGGVASALALFCIEQKQMNGVLHVGMDTTIPWKNKTVFSTTLSQITEQCGSRYCPASVCDNLDMILTSRNQAVFIGKPCEVAALRNAEQVLPQLHEKLGIAIGIFCAGTPSTEGIKEFLKRSQVELDTIGSLRFRGNGWPGNFAVTLKGKNRPHFSTSYAESWGFIQKYRPYRCYICPDGTSEFADISVGDPWYREISENESGYSLIVVRTEKGREFLKQAIEAGYITRMNPPDDLLIKSQINLYHKRSSLWARLTIGRLLGVPTPSYKGFSLFRLFCALPFKDQVKSIASTLKRIITRRYWLPRSKVS